MKKLFIYILLLLFFSNISFAEDDKKSLNDYLNDGYDIVKVDIKDSKTTRIYTLEKRKNIVLCYVAIGPERTITNCFAP